MKIFRYIICLSAVMVLSGCGIIDQLTTVNTDHAPSEAPAATTEQAESETETTTEEAEVQTETSGGNEGETEYEYFAVTVSEDRYLCGDEEYTLDELISEIEKLGEGYIIEIADDNATLKAYNELIDRLAEKSVEYIEKSED